jgi:hypothetical protein
MLTRDPGELKLLNMTNYKAILHCKGYSSREGGGAGTKVGSEGQQAENRYSICLHMLYCSGCTITICLSIYLYFFLSIYILYGCAIQYAQSLQLMSSVHVFYQASHWYSHTSCILGRRSLPTLRRSISLRVT